MPGLDEEVKVDGQRIRSLELTVLTQLRETLTGVTASLNRVGDKVDKMHERVMAIELAKFDTKIEETFQAATDDLRRTEKELQRQLDENRQTVNKLLESLTAVQSQLARLGAFVAVGGAIGGLALGAVLTKVFGA
jgi:prefoldin subunit 5